MHRSVYTVYIIILLTQCHTVNSSYYYKLFDYAQTCILYLFQHDRYKVTQRQYHLIKFCTCKITYNDNNWCVLVIIQDTKRLLVSRKTRRFVTTHWHPRSGYRRFYALLRKRMRARTRVSSVNKSYTLQRFQI